MKPLFITLLPSLHTPVEPTEVLDWDAHPGLVEGDVHVAPPLVLAEAPEPHLLSILGTELDPAATASRLRRTEELAGLPEDLHAAIPGALDLALPEDSAVRFRSGRLPRGAERGLAEALGRGVGVEAALSEARSRGADATLITWIVETRGAPLTATHMVGELVIADDVPVVVDHDSEPYAVEVELGLALVAASGEVLFRYQDSYEGLVCAGLPMHALARQVARDLVDEVELLWMPDPVPYEDDAFLVDGF